MVESKFRDTCFQTNHHDAHPGDQFQWNNKRPKLKSTITVLMNLLLAIRNVKISFEIPC